MLDASTIPLLLWAIFSGAVAMIVFLGGVLTYHWYRYAMSIPMVLLAGLIYATGSIACLTLVLSSIFALT